MGGYRQNMTTYNANTDVHDDNRANPMGAYITTLGTLIVLISVWLNWVTIGQGDETGRASSGYEADSIVPWMGFLGISLAIALLYATSRADRRQHRGLSLASMAVGLATLLFTIAFALDPIATRQYTPDDNISTEFGLYIAMLGALIWTIGSFLLAKEPEGDIERDTVRTETYARPTTTRATGVSETHSVTGVDDDTTRGATSTDDYGRGSSSGTSGSTGV